MNTLTDTFHCHDCGQDFTVHTSGETGYAVYGRGTSEPFEVCYPCAAVREKTAMENTGKAVLYLTEKGVGNWTSTLRFPILRRRKSKASSFGRSIPQEHAWFKGPDGYLWLAVCKGDMELARCRRLKTLA